MADINAAMNVPPPRDVRSRLAAVINLALHWGADDAESRDEAVRVADAILAAFHVAEWRPIAEAPRDQYVFVDVRDVRIAWWTRARGRHEGRWRTDLGPCNPTQFQPIPKFPAPPAEEG